MITSFKIFENEYIGKIMLEKQPVTEDKYKISIINDLKLNDNELFQLTLKEYIYLDGSIIAYDVTRTKDFTIEELEEKNILSALELYEKEPNLVEDIYAACLTCDIFDKKDIELLMNKLEVIPTIRTLQKTDEYDI